MAKRKFKYTLVVSDEEEITRCCGLTGIGGLAASLFDEAVLDIVHEDITTAILATTVPSQSKVVKALKERGFVALKKFRNSSTGNMVTIWYRKPRV